MGDRELARDAERGAVTRFCERHQISRAVFYKIRRHAGEVGPVGATEPQCWSCLPRSAAGASRSGCCPTTGWRSTPPAAGSPASWSTTCSTSGASPSPANRTGRQPRARTNGSTRRCRSGSTPPAKTIEALQALVDQFDQYYNNERAHQALDGKTPAEAWAATPAAPEPTPEPRLPQIPPSARATTTPSSTETAMIATRARLTLHPASTRQLRLSCATPGYPQVRWRISSRLPQQVRHRSRVAPRIMTSRLPATHVAPATPRRGTGMSIPGRVAVSRRR